MKIIAYLSLALLLAGCKTPSSTSESAPAQPVSDLLRAVAWSPAHPVVAVGGENLRVEFFSGNDYKRAGFYTFANTVTDLHWHPSQRKLAISAQGSARPAVVLDVTARKLTRLPVDTAVGCQAIRWSPDGELLAVGDDRGHLHLFTPTGHVVHQMDLGLGPVTGLSWHPGGQMLAAVGQGVAFFYLENKTVSSPLNGPAGQHRSVAWHPSGEHFAVGDHQGSPTPLLHCWSAAGQKMWETDLHQSPVRNLRWSADGSHLATASDHLRLFSPTGELLREASLEGQTWGLAWNATGQTLAVTTDARRLFFLDENLEVVKRKRGSTP